ncbi:hypothetical protein [Mangrovicoccus algicola]|uniref:Uncharacterized protein n=1 Tax=Mangrovicoccus algicola TaxID=2771008 RepID=A0A8J7CVU8_9RHOB|nr:hypothetical protein [Mangrovicoccus algicola]MBE3636897.1 hypothetical protein [Mangrovicoccus algicola]
MIPYGTMHHVYIHARWTWPTYTRAKAPVLWRRVFRLGRAMGRPIRRRDMPPPLGHAFALRMPYAIPVHAAEARRR